MNPLIFSGVLTPEPDEKRDPRPQPVSANNFVWKEFSRVLGNLPKAAKIRIAALKLGGMGAKTPSNNTDQTRNFYLKRVVLSWVSSGGLLKTATYWDSGPDGPLIRFMKAAVEPVFAQSPRRKPKPDALRHFVRSFLKRVPRDIGRPLKLALSNALNSPRENHPRSPQYSGHVHLMRT